MNESTVLRPLQTAITAAVAASTRPTTPVKYLGRVFAAPNDGIWLEVVHIPNNPNNMSWGGSENWRGIMRLILHWPLDDSGAYAPHDLLASISGYFSKDGVLWNGADAVKITENPISSGVIVTDRDQLYVATVEYALFKPKP